MKTARKGAIGRAQFRDARLARVRAKNRILEKDGDTFKIRSTANRVIQCPVCQAPVVDSKNGRKAHGQRQEKCREAMGI